MYGMAVEQLLGRTVAESRLFFATTSRALLPRVSLRDEAGQAGLEVLEIIDRAVAGAVLPAAPREGACGLCDFQAVCGPLEERRSRQGQSRRNGRRLLELRSMR